MLVFWVMFFLFSTLGIFLAIMSVKVLILDPYRTFRIKRNHQKRRAMLESKRQARRKLNSKKSLLTKLKKGKVDWSSYLFGIPFVLAVFIALPIFCFYVAVPEWLDLPRVLTGSRAELTGIIQEANKVEMKGRSWGYPFGCYINGKHYESTVDLREYQGERITVRYLPHTELITAVEH